MNSTSHIYDKKPTLKRAGGGDWGIVGGIGGSILGKATGMDDPIRDAIGGVMGEQAGNLLARLNPQETVQVNHYLQSAFRNAFREALYDVGGTLCFADAWKRSQRALPADLSAPLGDLLKRSVAVVSRWYISLGNFKVKVSIMVPLL